MKKIVTLIVSIVFVLGAASCAKEDHWGQNLDIHSKWWKKEGQSWDRKNNIFMAVGYSNPDWTDKYDLRQSADTNARSQVASFMQSLVENYAKEIRSRNFTISENIIELSAKETVVGSVVVARKYKGKKYYSLIKVDLNYFFKNIYDEYAAESTSRIRKARGTLTDEQVEQKIKQNIEAAAAKLKEAEVPAVEKSIKEAAHETN